MELFIDEVYCDDCGKYRSPDEFSDSAKICNDCRENECRRFMEILEE